MRIDELQQLSAWLVATDIRLLELNGPDVRLRLRHEGARVEVVDDTATWPPYDGKPAEVSRSVARAGSVGIFLHCHPLHEAPLTQPGASMRAGQTLGLLQIGGLLLPVTTPEDGTVTGTLVGHGEAVGFGTPLVEYQANFEAS